MFGIDSPFHHPSVEIQKVLTCGLDQRAQEDVFYNNAKNCLSFNILRQIVYRCLSFFY